MSEQFEGRLAALEARVAELEGGASAGDRETFTGGMVAYQGEVHLDGNVKWDIGYSPDGILEFSTHRTAEILAALGHPARLRIVRTLLRGPANASDLHESVGLGSTGQVYHHLKVLGAANVVEQHGRGDYRIAAKKVVPLLVSMLAAADISGELGT